MGTDLNIGHATAYAYAKSKGYTGTEEQFATELAQFAQNAQQVAEDRAAVEQLVDEFLNTTAPAVIQDVTDEGTSQVERVANAGTAQVTRVGQAGNTQIDAVGAAGTTQIGLVTAEGTTQVTRVQDKGDEVIDSIPADYTALTQEVSDLNQQISDMYVFTRNLNTKGSGRYREYDGVITSSSKTYFGMADKIPCDPNTEYAILYNEPKNGSHTSYTRFYDENEEMIADVEIRYTLTENLSCFTVTTPANARYIYTYAYRSGEYVIDEDSGIQVERGYASTPYVPSRIEASQESLDGTLTDIPFDSQPGYYTADGSMSGASLTNKERTTQKFDFSALGDIQFNLAYESVQSMWIAEVFFDSNKNFINRSVIIINKEKIGFPVVNIPYNAQYVAFSYRTFGEATVHIRVTGNAEKLYGIVYAASDDANKVKTIADNALKSAAIGFFAGRFKPCYDHLFVSKAVSSIQIPHESLYHVRLSKKMGFDVIEANTAKTSDGVYVVNHFSSGTFGDYFHHVDETTDISGIAVSSVTWAWIEANVRYNSTVPKYRTRPPRLEEFLQECRQQNIIPFVYTAEQGAIDIADSYMGQGNYIAYGSDREKCPFAVIYRWLSLTTKSEILDYCREVGAPFIYGMANPTAFTDEQLSEIVSELHKEGFWIGTSYQDQIWHKLSAMGFDVNGTQGRINRIESGNICNLDSVFGFNDFTVVGATETNGVLTFDSDGTITPNIQTSTESVCGVDIELDFSGTITIPTTGEYVGSSYTSDGSYPFFVAFPILNGDPKVTISVQSGAVIRDIQYKASKF